MKYCPPIGRSEFAESRVCAKTGAHKKVDIHRTPPPTDRSVPMKPLFYRLLFRREVKLKQSHNDLYS